MFEEAMSEETLHLLSSMIAHTLMLLLRICSFIYSLLIFIPLFLVCGSVLF